ncbi:MAG TPA: transglycosylase SLT domain-containing protein [Blastocatellia bacterium]|nr:transglycosylase SLT domain-containing protein [Blastocatellia bacterium]
MIKPFAHSIGPSADNRASGRIKTEVIRLFPAEVSEVSAAPRPPARRTRFKSLTILPLTALMVLVVGMPGVKESVMAPATDATSLTVANSQLEAAPSIPPLKRWSRMAADEQTAFVTEQAQRISAMLGENPHPFSRAAVQAIRDYVDSYARRSGSASEAPWEEGLRRVFDRAGRHAPTIVRAFRDRRVPAIIGLYLPMIESEYRTCLESPYGAKGLFQFMPGSARIYGVAAKDLCDIEKMAPAAAQYVADRMTEFGSDSKSMTLVLLSFNRSPAAVRRDLIQLRQQNPDLERSFWMLFDHADKLDSYFKQESRNYVPKFFAAVIVGENPETFDLRMMPLSAQGE